MQRREGDLAADAAAIFVEMFGDSALLQACVFGYETLSAREVDRCLFWQRVVEKLAAEGERRAQHLD